MAFLEININDLPQPKYGLIAEGWYAASIQEVELKATKDGSGQKLSVKFAILGPTQQGRSIYANINIKNNSKTAEEIGRAQLGELMRAIGLSHVSDTDQFVGGNLQIKVVVKPASVNKLTGEQYEEKNEVKGYKATGDAMVYFGKPVEVNPDDTATIKKMTGSAPPWAKK